MGTFLISALSNFKICSTLLLTLVTMLYFISPGFIYLITGICAIWLPLPPPSTPHLRQPLIWLLCLWGLVLCFPFFRIPISKILRWLSFPLWLISLRIMPQGPFCLTLLRKLRLWEVKWLVQRHSWYTKRPRLRRPDFRGICLRTVLPPAWFPATSKWDVVLKSKLNPRWKARLDTLILPALILALPLFSWMTFGKLQGYLFFLLAYQEKSCLLVRCLYHEVVLKIDWHIAY